MLSAPTLPKHKSPEKSPLLPQGYRLLFALVTALFFL